MAGLETPESVPVGETHIAIAVIRQEDGTAYCSIVKHVGGEPYGELEYRRPEGQRKEVLLKVLAEYLTPDGELVGCHKLAVVVTPHLLVSLDRTRQEASGDVVKLSGKATL